MFVGRKTRPLGVTTSIKPAGYKMVDSPYQLRFDGTNDYAVARIALAFGTGDFSMGGWFNADTIGAYEGLINNRDSSGDKLGCQIRFDDDADALEAFLDCGSTTFSIKTAFSDTGNWHHVIVTADRDGNMILYLDGLSVGSADISGQSSVSVTNADPIVLAKNEASAYFDGYLNEMAVWSNVLSKVEVSAMYKNKTYRRAISKVIDLTQNSRHYKSAKGLTAWWRGANDGGYRNGALDPPNALGIFVMDSANKTKGDERFAASDKTAMGLGTSLLNDAGDAYSSYNGWRVDIGWDSPTANTDGLGYIKLEETDGGAVPRLIGSITGIDPGSGYSTYEIQFDYRANGYVHHAGYQIDSYSFDRTTDAYNDSISESDNFVTVKYYTEGSTPYIFDMRVNNNKSNYNTVTTAGDRIDIKNITWYVLADSLPLKMTNTSANGIVVSGGF